MRGGLKAQLYRTAQGKRSGALGSHKHMGKRSQATLRVRAMRMVCYFEHRSHRSHGFLSHAESKRLRGHQCMRGRAESPIAPHSPGQAQRHPGFSLRTSEPTFAPCKGRSHWRASPKPNPHTYGVLCHSSSSAYQACVEQCSPHTWLPNITPMGVTSPLTLYVNTHLTPHGKSTCICGRHTKKHP